METEEEGRETGGEVSIGEASWLQGKAEMLDEVTTFCIIIMCIYVSIILYR